MTIKQFKHVRLWMAVAISVILWTVGAGFYRDLSASNEETYKGLKLFSDVIELIEKNYVDPVDAKKLVDDAIQGMVHGLDPHSSLLSPEDYRDLQVDTQGEFTGIGVSITLKEGLVTVVSPIEGTPAYRAGLKAGDIITRVGNEAVKNLKDAVNRIRGPKGTSVQITIVREGTPEPLNFEIMRDIIPIESVRSMTLKPHYGYVWVTNFRENTTQDLIKALEKLEKQDAQLKGLILDLRNNPGGLLNQAIEVADIFIEKGIILSIKGRQDKHAKVFTAKPNDVIRNYPVIVLINGGSASASEIVAGALQDHKRALILGTTSFGKGSVQNVEALRDGYGLKLTIARYYTPNGRSIQAKGIEPDIVIKFEPRKKPEKTSSVETLMPKEKDLENHLKEESESITRRKIVKPDPDQEPGTPSSGESADGSVNQERLESDNQVMRALEMLISYDVFKALKN
jgi:carboxyl-terminal processing protease